MKLQYIIFWTCMGFFKKNSIKRENVKRPMNNLTENMWMTQKNPVYVNRNISNFLEAERLNVLKKLLNSWKVIYFIRSKQINT